MKKYFVVNIMTNKEFWKKVKEINNDLNNKRNEFWKEIERKVKDNE